MRANVKMKPADLEAANIEFGIELETMIPATAGIEIGAYHHGGPVTAGNALNGQSVAAPSFNGNYWRAERDGSIRVLPGFVPCEFVSPILKGDAGIEALVQMMEFIRAIGGKVNDSCGCHVTVGIKPAIGTSDLTAMAQFVKRLTCLANQNAWAIYAQTGTGRHTNHYSHTLRAETDALLDQIETAARRGDAMTCRALAEQCGRGMVNLRKAFNASPCIEFRAFAGTLNTNKALHHIATAVGLMRRAAVAKVDPNFNHKAAKNAKHAVRRMWRLLGWVSYRRAPVAYGMFPALHTRFAEFCGTAMDMASKFETRFPNANL